MNNTLSSSTIYPADSGGILRVMALVIGSLLVLMLASLFYLSDQNLMGEGDLNAEFTGEITALSPNDISSMLLRTGLGPNDSEMDALYAPTWYFNWNNRALPEISEPVLVFFLIENIHSGELSEGTPFSYLQFDETRVDALSSRVVSEAPHHRVSEVIFPLMNAEGQPHIREASEHLTLIMPITEGQSAAELPEENIYQWDLPLPYGLGALNAPEFDNGSLPTIRFTWTALLAIMGGMLSALSPCLLQLGVYYAAVLAGTEAGVSGIKDNSRAQIAVIRTSLFFVIGFTLVYTVGGVIAGYVGQSLEQLDALQNWFRPVSFVAGVIIIVLAIRVAIQTRAPLVCRLPMRVSNGSGRFSSALMGISFAVGCLSCFSATVLSALLLYAGSTGSPLSGGMLLFLFSSGVGLIFLMAAFLMVYAAPQFTDTLYRLRPYVGGLSAIVMIIFGLLMVTYEFHTVSGFLFDVFNR